MHEAFSTIKGRSSSSSSDHEDHVCGRWSAGRGSTASLSSLGGSADQSSTLTSASTALSADVTAITTAAAAAAVRPGQRSHIVAAHGRTLHRSNTDPISNRSSFVARSSSSSSSSVELTPGGPHSYSYSQDDMTRGCEREFTTPNSKKPYVPNAFDQSEPSSYDQIAAFRELFARSNSEQLRCKAIYGSAHRGTALRRVKSMIEQPSQRLSGGSVGGGSLFLDHFASSHQHQHQHQSQLVNALCVTFPRPRPCPGLAWYM